MSGIAEYFKQMINIPTDDEALEMFVGSDEGRKAYKLGHRDARHAAADIASDADRFIEYLMSESQQRSEEKNCLKKELKELKARLKELENESD